MTQGRSRYRVTHTAMADRKFSGKRGLRGRIHVPGSTRLIVATDGSWKKGFGGFGYVTRNGYWAIAARQQRGENYHLTPHRDHGTGALVMELRAVGLAIAHFQDRAVRFLIDSEAAISFLRAWQVGDVTKMPTGYSLRPRFNGDARPALVRLAMSVSGRDDLRFVKVAAHDGHPMNEVADGLASIARRAARGKLGDELAVGEHASAFVSAFVESRSEAHT